MTTELHIRGLVQGIGFRPFICRLAHEMNLDGEVVNCNNGVTIRLNTTPEVLKIFIDRIRTEKPVVSYIDRIDVSEQATSAVYVGFEIVSSHSVSDEITQVAPDIAVCDACMKDIVEQKHRIGYPFVNCTHCGPRFSIIRELPYDRINTTMASFTMCSFCDTEYHTIENRRFHAQPTACTQCGPSYYCRYDGKKVTDYKKILFLSARLLSAGEVIAVKGTGGYHLICDAANTKAVDHMREIKKRDGKPFGVLFRSLDSMKEYVFASKTEQSQLLSWRRPIVLLKERKKIAEGINPGLHTLGCMLPSMPIHYHWFEQLQTDALIMTSGNLTDTPVIISTEEAEKTFSPILPLVLHHNRMIYNRADDSVLQVCGGNVCLIRRSRGYVPEPFFADIRTEGILAFGAEKVNTFALGKEDTIIRSQYIGDLKNWETYQFYTESLCRFKHLFRFVPSQLVCDLHSDYLSSREAVKYALALNIPLLKVQHHHAHAVACMLEHGLHHHVIAVVFDGTGLGTDGTIWGGEFLLCNRASFQRLSHIDSIPMPGGDKAAKEPWRMAVACLFHYFGENVIFPEGFAERIGHQKIENILGMLSKKINSPYSSGMGRIFDAVSSLLGFCDIASFQAEAPIRLEQEAADDFCSCYPIETGAEVINLRNLFEGILVDLQQGIPVPIIAATFHNSLVCIIIDKCKQLIRQTGVSEVILSGGCFQNKRLTEQLIIRFKEEGIPLYIPQRIPCNDEGIAVGQLTVAASSLKVI